MIIGAFAVMAMKEMCKCNKKHQETSQHTDGSPSPAAAPDYPPTAQTWIFKKSGEYDIKINRFREKTERLVGG